jgi:hypothetical protein
MEGLKGDRRLLSSLLGLKWEWVLGGKAVAVEVWMDR